MRTSTTAAVPRQLFNVLTGLYDAEKVWPKAIRRELAGHDLADESLKSATIRETRKRVGDSLRAGRNVVDEGILYVREQRDDMRRLARLATGGNVDVVLLEIRTPLADVRTLLETIHARHSQPAERVEADMEHIRSEQLPFIEWPSDTGEQCIQLNGARPMHELVGKVDSSITRMRAEEY